MKNFLLLILSFSLSYSYSQTHKILSSTETSIKIQFDFTDSYTFGNIKVEDKNFLKIDGPGFDFREPGQPWLPEYVVNVAIPFNSNPELKVNSLEQSKRTNVMIMPYPKDDPQFKEINLQDIDQEIYNKNDYFPGFISAIGSEFIFRYARIIPIRVSPFQYNPVTRELQINNRITVEISYHEINTGNRQAITDSFTRDYLYSTVVNPKEAQKWGYKLSQAITFSDSNWYNPNKNYFKMFLNQKGVYRITYEYLVGAGVPLGSDVNSDKLELINNGNSTPIDIFDGTDGVFGPGDYFQFVGYPPDSTPYCRLNIYNNSNVYWFSYEGDSASNKYTNVDGFPNYWLNSYISMPKALHFEQDSIYEPLGYAGNDLRDFWFWGKASVQNKQINSSFQFAFNQPPGLNVDSAVTIRVDMHGLTNNGYCNPDHWAIIDLSGKVLDTVIWNDQTQYRFDQSYYLSRDSIIIGEDSISIYPTGNFIRVTVDGDSCTSFSDEIRINWLELEYDRMNAANDNNFDFISPARYSGINRFWLYHWNRDNMTVYIPSKGKKITNAQIVNDEYKSALFVDTVNQETEYFCVASDYFLSPDSIKQDQPSDLFSNTNGADYIIIAHKKFTSVAEQLKSFREGYFPDTTIINPRVKICYIDDIYDEFSGGLLDPFAVQKFLKNAFENWQAPAPAYVVLMGDMSYDYRHLLSSSRENYIPSIPYYTHTYGLAVSDNMFAAVSGNDVVPEMALSRFSIETIEEGNIFLDKIRNYPADNTKEWKQNVLLISSGLSAQDEAFFGFNNASVKLEDLYLKPNGFKATKIMRYPNQPQYQQYEGGGPEIRKAISDGTVFVNYYGHGGGYQWDLTFLNDDIYLLENGGRLPFISSVTCYTAHFDNQDVFGEQFIKVPGKGAIAFFGSSGLTLWGIGTYINEVLFDQIFAKREYITGKAILTTKSLVGGSGGFYNSQIALLTLLGEPLLKLCLPDKPDFLVQSSNITVEPNNPLVNDTAQVSVTIKNLGVTFPGDSVSVSILAVSEDTSYIITNQKLPSFGEEGSLTVNWIPQSGGLYDLTLRVNEDNSIAENDLSDNEASASFAVFDLGDPSIVEPIDGFSSTAPIINFLLADIGHYIEQNISYNFEIDTSISFQNPLSVSGGVLPEDAVVKWISPALPEGVYFWRVRIFDGSKYSPYSDIRSFTISSVQKDGYYAHSKIFKRYQTYNVNYSEGEEALILNNSPLPPRPSDKTLIGDITVVGAVFDTVGLTTITTDGTFIYFANIWYYAQQFDTTSFSRIHRVGTGNNGTDKGKYYGVFSDFYGKVDNQIFYLDNHIYVATGNPFYLTRIDVGSGMIDSVNIPVGMLNSETARVEGGSFYLATDGVNVYNLTFKDTLGNDKYTLRIFNPADWSLLKQDQILSGSSYAIGFTGFFVAGNYLYPTENYSSNTMRRINLNTNIYEEEWIIFNPPAIFQGYYAWTYDWIKDEIYASVFRNYTMDPKFSKFYGSYLDATGNTLSPPIGPASKWKSIKYDIENQTSSGTYKVDLLGFNKNTRLYDTLYRQIPPDLPLDSISAEKYDYLKAAVEMTDSSTGGTSIIKLKSISVDYLTLPEIIFIKKDFIVTPDTTIQGFDITLDFEAKNIGKVPGDNLKLDFFLDDRDSSFYSQVISIASDSSVPIQSQIFSTAPMSPATLHKIKAVGVLEKSEYFTFNNILTKGFYVARDSIQPDLNITIDGKEIINGDVVSSRPDILITLKDESPLPLDTSLFTVVYNNIPLNFTRPDVSFESSPYPNNEFRLRWNPELPDGRHVLEVLAKDPSGNFSDTIARRIVFYIVNSFDLVEVYNYPNPFSSETYFTFQLYGDNSKLEEFKIKVYTVAGRMIREFDVPTDQLRAGFNKLQWDGRDQDGDLIANGVYFYKVITRNNGEVKTKIQKLAKVN